MNDKILEMIENSKFTSSQIEKSFLPRRIGLGYDFKYVNREMDIIKQCKKQQHKLRKKTKYIEKNDEEEEEILLSKSKMVNRYIK